MKNKNLEKLLKADFGVLFDIQKFDPAVELHTVKTNPVINVSPQHVILKAA